MATQKTYFEKLKDPRWQKKRLEVMERDSFTCQNCYSEKETLNVHHLKYSGNPWDAPNDDLITLCSTCHEEVENKLKGLKDLMNYAITLQEENGIIKSIDLISNFVRLLIEPAVIDSDYLKEMQSLIINKYCSNAIFSVHAYYESKVSK